MADGTPVLRAGNIGNELEVDRNLIWVPSKLISPNQRMRVGDIALCASSGSSTVVGKSALLRRVWNGTVGAFCVLIRPNSTRCIPDYLAFVLRGAKFRGWTRIAAGASIKNIRKRDLESFPIILPPMDEQRRIVDILNRAARIEALQRRAGERLREFVSALFIRRFGDRHEIGRRFPCFPLREVAAIASGATKGRKIDATDSVEVPYLRVANVQDGFLDLDKIKTITIRRGEEQRYALAPGDLVMTEGGDQDKLGRAAVWNGELPYCAHQNHVFRVRPHADVVVTDYLRDVAGSAYGKAYFLSVAKRTTGIASINKTQLGGLPVPVPPLDLQHGYAEIVGAAGTVGRLRGTGSRTGVTLIESLMSMLLEYDESECDAVAALGRGTESSSLSSLANPHA